MMPERDNYKSDALSIIATKKDARLNLISRASEKRQRPTLPPGGAVPSALVCLTSLFGMGRGGSTLL